MIEKIIGKMNEAEMREYADECEKVFEDQLDRAVEKLISEPELKIITLSGPTCSGKTTTAEKIIKDLAEVGKRVVVVSIDDFFHGAPEDIRESFLQKKPEVDFDSIKAIDLECFVRCSDDIFEGRDTMLPIFDFKTTRRTGYRKLEAKSYDIVIFEGIQAVYPEITDLLAVHGYESIFTNVWDDLRVNGVFFDRREIRLMRRIVRDYRFRNASLPLTMFLWDSVVKNEDINILPYADNADIKINSLLPYEIHLLKEPLCEILDGLPEENEYYGFAAELKKKFEVIPVIPSKFVPECSVYREFLG